MKDNKYRTTPSWLDDFVNSFKKGMTIKEVANIYDDCIVLITTKGHIVCAKYRYNI